MNGAGVFVSPSTPLSFLAFDFGTRRVGVATGNTLTRNPQPLRTVAAEGEARFAAIGKLIAEWQPDALVVGVPFHPDGAAHDNTQRARRFAVISAILLVLSIPALAYVNVFRVQASFPWHDYWVPRIQAMIQPIFVDQHNRVIGIARPEAFTIKIE